MGTESVCEGAGSAMVCVLLRTDTETEVTATVEPSDLSATSKTSVHLCVTPIVPISFLDSFSLSDASPT